MQAETTFLVAPTESVHRVCRCLTALVVWLAAAACASATAPAPPSNLASVAAPRPAFRHPGVLVTAAQLRFVRDQVAAGRQPWKAAFDTARASKFAALSYTPRPRAIVECGPRSRPNHGCSDEREDGLAAYTHALLWNLTGEQAHASKAIEILDAWSAVLESHTNHNAPLQGGWAGVTFTRAAELMKWTSGNGHGPDWPKDRIARFARMLKTAFAPTLGQRSGANGNWELVMIEATIGAAIFTDDHELFQTALQMWRTRVPAYIYLSSDGPRPVPPPLGNGKTPDRLIDFWQGQATFVDGLAQETCRDLGHAGWGLTAAVDTAETALLQGVDLYAEQAPRLRAGLEFQANLLLGAPAPPWLCGGNVIAGGAVPSGEIALNHFQQRLGQDLPQTKALVHSKLRPSGAGYFIAWETLTHADAGWVGVR